MVVEKKREDFIELLAKLLHESGREAVDKKMVYRNDLPMKPFAEWDDLHEDAKEGRRMMARFLIKQSGEVFSLITCALYAKE